MTGPIPDEFLDLMAEKFRMLADPSRLAILRALMAGEKSVGQVVEESGRGQANVSKHLKLLAEAGLVSRRRDGMQVFYRITDPLVERLCKLVCETILEDFEREQRDAEPAPREGPEALISADDSSVARCRRGVGKSSGDDRANQGGELAVHPVRCSVP